MPKRDSTVRGREFGAGMREALAKAGLTGRGAAEPSYYFTINTGHLA